MEAPVNPKSTQFGVKVSGLGFKDLGFRVQALGFRVWGGGGGGVRTFRV